MDSDESPSPPPQLTGLVIITLPPPNNPSLGKTITAYTLTDNSPQSQQTHHQQQQEHPLPAQLHPPQDSQFNFSLPMLFPVLPRKLFLFLAISIFALTLYGSVFSYTLQDRYKSNNDDENKESFVFPLYHKFGIREVLQRDAEFKLGRFVDLDGESVVASVNDGIIRPHKSKINKKLVSSNAVAVDSSSTFPLRGNVYPDGLYFTYMIVGNPPRRYYLDMDTGSDLTWIQCDAPCSSCAKGANPLYKPRMGNILPYKDSLCMEIQRNHKPGYCETCQQCDYEIEYADHSTSMGVLARDELHLTIENGSLTKPNVVFGCAYDQQGLLLNTLVKTDGILGLSRAKVSLPSQLASQGIIKNVVGHCLTTNAGGGGYMFLGHDLVPSWGMAWVPMLDSPFMELYHTEILKINYGSSPLNLGARNSQVGWALFDTGSSYTYFTKQAYSELIASLKEVSSDGLVLDASDPTLPVCWRAKFPIRSIVDVKQYFKTLTLHFGSKWHIVSTKFRISPEGYLVISKKGNICLGILDGSEVHDGSTIILGDISLHGQLVVYDNVNKRIGWAKSKNYDESTADTTDQEVESLLKKLNFIPSSVFTTDLLYVDFLDRVHKAELKLRSKGLWEVPHPWLNLFVPKSRIAEFDKGVFKGSLGNKTGGPILIYPMNKHKWDNRSSVVTPDEDVFYLVAFLRSALDNGEEMQSLEYLNHQNRQILKFCDEAGIQAKQYLPHYTTQEEWVDHFGDKWGQFYQRKMEFDPRYILATGQRIFKPSFQSSSNMAL